ncbi:hypothetical protein TRAPUB_11477, partial [Trametes pubescens]
PLPPTPQSPGTTTSPARFSTETRGAHFVPVTVLMEVREDDLEEHDQPPPYQPRSQEIIGVSSVMPIGTKDRDMEQVEPLPRILDNSQQRVLVGHE